MIEGSAGDMESFSKVVQIAKLLDGFAQPWFIAGGWALDLFIGKVTRVHSDIEITVLRKDQNNLRQYLGNWEFTKVVNGVMQSWNQDEWLELPIHEIHAQKKSSKLPPLEILLNESSQDEYWKFRRNFEIVRPLSRIGLRSNIGVPFLAPEIILLYKAKNPRFQDEDDFNHVRELLNQERQVWLKQVIALCHPEHHWLTELCNK